MAKFDKNKLEFEVTIYEYAKLVNLLYITTNITDKDMKNINVEKFIIKNPIDENNVIQCKLIKKDKDEYILKPIT